jgi:two-component sensor histidine kinase
MLSRKSSLVIVGVLALVGTGFAQIQKIDSLSKALQSSLITGERVSILTSISELYIRIDFRKAVEFAEVALSTAGGSADPQARALALTNRALVYWYNGEYANSIDMNQQAITLRKQSGDWEGIAGNHQKIALNYYYKADYEDAIRFYRIALAEYRKSVNSRQGISVLNQIALVYNKQGKYDSASRYLYEFSTERQKLLGYQGRTYNLVESTPFFRSKEYFQVELDLQLKALKNLQMKGNDRDILFTHLNIADSYRELEAYELALHHLKIADQYYSHIGWMRNCNGLGNAYLRLGLPDSAIMQFQEGVKVATEKGTKISLLAAYTGLGEGHEAKGNFGEALKNLKVGLQLTSEMGNKLDVILTSHRVGEVYMKLLDWESASIYCGEALRLAYAINAKKQIRDGLFCKSKILSALGHHEASLKAYQEGKLLGDSLITGEADLQFAQMQAQLELDKKNQDIDELNRQKELQRARLKNMDQLIYGIIIVLVLSVLLGVSTYLRFRQKSRANKILQEQKHQIETLLAEIHHRVKNNLQVISSLLSIQSDQLKNKNARMAVLEGQSRVQAMGLIHENIYKTENFAFIDMAEYLKKLSSSLVDSYGIQELNIEIRTDRISVDVDTAILLGLIINELLTNSLKHAFAKVKNPSVVIDLHLDENKLLNLRITDNGRGFLIPANHESFGLKLVKELANQLGGSVEFVPGQGFCVMLKFKKFKLAA